MTRWWLIRSQVPSSRNRANQRYTVRNGGKPSGSMSQAHPARMMNKIASTMRRIGHLRLRPQAQGGGSSGSRIAHSALLRSLPSAQRRPAMLPAAGRAPHAVSRQASNTRRESHVPRPANPRHHTFRLDSEMGSQPDRKRDGAAVKTAVERRTAGSPGSTDSRRVNQIATFQRRQSRRLWPRYQGIKAQVAPPKSLDANPQTRRMALAFGQPIPTALTAGRARRVKPFLTKAG